jgi:hypothetical protein
MAMDGPSQIRRESREIVFFRSKTEEICSDIGDDGIILWALFLLSGLTQLAIRRMAKKREGLNRKGIYVGILSYSCMRERKRIFGTKRQTKNKRGIGK